MVDPFVTGLAALHRAAGSVAADPAREPLMKTITLTSASYRNNRQYVDAGTIVPVGSAAEAIDEGRATDLVAAGRAVPDKPDAPAKTK